MAPTCCFFSQLTTISAAVNDNELLYLQEKKDKARDLLRNLIWNLRNPTICLKWAYNCAVLHRVIQLFNKSIKFLLKHSLMFNLGYIIIVS